MPKFRKAPETLFDVVQDVIDRLDLEDSYFVEIDIPEDIRIPAAVRPLEDLLETLLSQAASHTPSGGELTVIGWESPEYCEIEVADSGTSILQRNCTSPVTSAIVGAALLWQDCPQGGAAVTVRFPHQAAQRRVA